MDRRYTYKGARLTDAAYVLESDQYYNLATGRVVTKGDKKHQKIIISETFRIYGLPEEVEEFQRENAGDPTSQQLFQTQPGLISGWISRCIPFGKKNSTPCLTVPDGDPQMRLRSEAGLDALSEFTFQGMSGMGKIIRVIDGDTLEILIHVSLRRWAEGCPCRDGTRKYAIIPCENSVDASFYTRARYRLYGVDAAESDTREGQVVKLYVQLLLEKYHGIVYYEIRKEEKYGRELADIYLDEARTLSLAAHLCHLPSVSSLGTLAKPYFGLAKDPSLTSLPSFKSDYFETSTWKEECTAHVNTLLNIKS